MSSQIKKMMKGQKAVPGQENNQSTSDSAPINTLVDKIIPGKEFESLLSAFRPGVPVNLNLADEIRKVISEVESIRGKPLLCYIANVVNSKLSSPTGIETNDDLPFSEMVSMVASNVKAVDVLLVTPGGSGEQVAKFVNKLRPRFDSVSFILPNMAMSAGTILVTSGDEIIMDSRAYIGPIDPQVPSREGRFIPAQSILTLIKDIQDRGQAKIQQGQNPDWTDMQILNRIDAREIGNAINGSKYSTELVTKYLYEYKFKTWTTHSSTGAPVTDKEKQEKAKEIANLLCDHGEWKTHSRGITRESAWSDCKLKITKLEDIGGLEQSIRKFWALLYWAMENTSIYKLFISSNYAILRQENQTVNKN